MALDGLGGKNIGKIGDLPEFGFSEFDFKEVEQRASIFIKGNNFFPVNETVKLVDVQKDGKLVYEDGNGEVFTANSQHELAELHERDTFKMPGFFGGIVDKAKSIFSTDDGNFA